MKLGFNPQYLGALIGGLSSQNLKAVSMIPGITPQIIGAGVAGLKMAFINATKYIWVFGIGESASYRLYFPGLISLLPALSGLAAVICIFIENLSHEYTAEIDHPVEKVEVVHKEYAA